MKPPRKALRNIFKGLSATSLAFVFQACYGPVQDLELDVLIEGSVTSSQGSEPVPGIKVSVAGQPQHELTDGSGRFSMFAAQDSVYRVRFEDADSLQNGAFLPKDTVVTTTDDRITLNVSLDAR
ncbi:MAG: carboxypeptidase-like regulatory domain-containing protein [Prevotellaceae bacterium]|jgi:hypothetical protein|nr:carboxypeptidase-like regulatory domain-containing protein [Prevotellaceae bacterium]